MNSTESRLEQLIEKFWKGFKVNAISELQGLVNYPGGFVFINEREAKKQGITGIARTIRMRSTIQEKIIDPCFEIRIVREKFDNLTDDEILFLIAHELSHAVMQASNSIWSEYAADVLAEYYFGIKNPQDSSIGYLSSKDELTRK